MTYYLLALYLALKICIPKVTEADKSDIKLSENFFKH